MISTFKHSLSPYCFILLQLRKGPRTGTAILKASILRFSDTGISNGSVYNLLKTMRQEGTAKISRVVKSPSGGRSMVFHVLTPKGLEEADKVIALLRSLLDELSD